VGFILYAVIFFALLYVMEKTIGIEFFGFGRE